MVLKLIRTHRVFNFAMRQCYCVLLFCVLSSCSETNHYLTEWNPTNGRASQTTCVDIPKNLSLCYGIGYHKMRLPNLLEHDTMFEVSNQAASWVPLLNVNCHPDTRLFLCSLFSPVCLDRPIFPCRSLCNAVKQGCEKRMEKYGFPWPDMVRCDRYPIDNDMCITVQSQNTDSSPCSACRQPGTTENIIDNFCRADIVVKTKVRKLSKQSMLCKKTKILKYGNGLSKKNLKRPTFTHVNMTECCGELINKAGKNSQFLVMSVKQDERLTITFVMKWKKSPEFKKASKIMKKIDCRDPKMLSEAMMSDGMFHNANKIANKKSRGERSKKQRNLSTVSLA